MTVLLNTNEERRSTKYLQIYKCIAIFRVASTPEPT